MKKDLMKNNCYDVDETMCIMGSCLEYMFPETYKKLEKEYTIYDLCLEQTHLNMALTKIIGMVVRKKVKNIIFVSVDKSPHCVQLHYIVTELRKFITEEELNVKNYVATDKGLEEIPFEVISLSKNLSGLNETLKNKNHKKDIK